MEISLKTKIELPYDPAVPLLGIYLEKPIAGKDPRAQCSRQHFDSSRDREATYATIDR